MKPNATSLSSLRIEVPLAFCPSHNGGSDNCNPTAEGGGWKPNGTRYTACCCAIMVVPVEEILHDLSLYYNHVRVDMVDENSRYAWPCRNKASASGVEERCADSENWDKFLQAGMGQAVWLRYTPPHANPLLLDTRASLSVRNGTLRGTHIAVLTKCHWKITRLDRSR